MSTQISLQALSVVATFVLARLLGQATLGIVAAANGVLLITYVILALGIDAAVVRRPKLDDNYLSTAWWASTALSTAVCVVVAAGSPLLARLYGLPSATAYIAVLAISLPLGAGGSVTLALLQRRFWFGRAAAVQVGSMVLYAGVQLGLAAAGMGAWAVIIGQLTLGVASTLGGMVATGWHPRAVCRPQLLRGDVQFAAGMVGYQVAGYVARFGDAWAVGQYLGATGLGTYYVAAVLPGIIRLRMSMVTVGVLLPVASRSLDDARAAQELYLSAYRMQLAIGMPAMAGVAVLSRPIVVVFFGSSWGASVTPLRLLAIAAMVELTTVPAEAFALARGQPGRLAIPQAIRASMMLPMAFVAMALWHSLAAAAAAALASTLVWAVLHQRLVAARLGFPFRAVRRDALNTSAATTVMACFVGISEVLCRGLPNGAQVTIGVGVGVATYVAAGMLFFRPMFSQVLANVLPRKLPRAAAILANTNEPTA